MQPDQDPDNITRQQLQRHDPSQSPGADTRQAHASHPEQPVSRSIADHNPVSLTFHNVSTSALELLLGEKLPEIERIVATCLRQTILDGATIPAHTLLEGYADATRYSICQTREFRLGSSGALEESHRIIIQRHSDEEPSIFELSLGSKSPRAVDFTVSYVWTEESDRWDDLNSWGSLVGVETIDSLFTNTPPELYEVDSLGLCTSLLPGDISIRTEPLSSGVEAPSGPTVELGTSAHWAPRAVHVSTPLYSEQAVFLEAISPDLHKLLVQSGLLPTLDAFVTNEASPQARLLERAAMRLDQDIGINFTRLVQLGPEEVGHSQEYEDSRPEESFEDHICEGIGTPGAEDEDLAQGANELSNEDGERIPFSLYPVKGLPVSSYVSIDVRHDQLGPIRVEYVSTAQQHGMLCMYTEDPFNFAVPVIGVRFLNDSPSLRELASRWRLLREIAKIGKISIDRKEIEANLFFSATTPSRQEVPADFASRRVLIGFDPPQAVFIAPDVSAEE
jgi:hypothetical protein